ncbi:YggS family pyridoxal phosphate-dependent enzyme [Caldalkalibacillus salinus]|uniref:YggS family pyridoxal phosphate-dependent enzyme n=1 Tax=Caldalkalibacillus salinus TaxID=2803787 RepID=UPI0019228ADB
MTVKENLTRIQQEVQAACQRVNRDPDEVNIIAVTKYVSIERMQEAFDAGIVHIGENKVQQAVQKWNQLYEHGVWHFIGHLQSNKVKDIIDKMSMIHSLDRLSLAKEIEKRAGAKNIVVPCFIQVNVSGEETKHGLHLDEVESFIQRLEHLPHIQAVGLMTMALYVEDPEETRPIFRQLKALQKRLKAKQYPHAPLNELSMGMSNDYVVAIEEGATFIRLGTSLVGNELKS